jgi:glycerol-3-phosphate dehydrogenase (NAD(P)+)
MITVVGAGSWGTALAQVLALSARPVKLWGRDPGLARRIDRERRNPAYLPGIPLHRDIDVHVELDAALDGADVAILAVPTHGMRATAGQCAPLLADACAVVSAAKGFEADTQLTMSQVIVAVLGEATRSRVAAISGPNIAPELARGLPAATVVASDEPETAALVRDACNGTQLRFYSSDDLTGVEYGGALKNVVAIAAGICDGVGAGDNGKAALITRGIAEMARLGVRAGANPITFAGLTGLGDCVVTCFSPHSRNRGLGEAIGRGRSLLEVEAGMFQVAEGVNAARGARRLAEQWGVEMPIVAEVSAVLFEGKPIVEALADLMRRDARDELREFRLQALEGAAPHPGAAVPPR